MQLTGASITTSTWQFLKQRCALAAGKQSTSCSGQPKKVSALNEVHTSKCSLYGQSRAVSLVLIRLQKSSLTRVNRKRELRRKSFAPSAKQIQECSENDEQVSLQPCDYVTTANKALVLGQALPY